MFKIKTTVGIIKNSEVMAILKISFTNQKIRIVKIPRMRFESIATRERELFFVKILIPKPIRRKMKRMVREVVSFSYIVQLFQSSVRMFISLKSF